jgi:hypothetical protein
MVETEGAMSPNKGGRFILNPGMKHMFFILLAGFATAVMFQPAFAAQGGPDNLSDRITGVRFHTGDTGICQVEPGWIEATVFVTLPDGVSARLQLAHHVVKPHKTDIKYSDGGIVKHGDTYTFSAYWPGIQRGDKSVEIHWGAALLDIHSGSLLNTTGLDFFWYPYICNPYESTPAITVSPTITRTASIQPPRKTTIPDQENQLPTLAPPFNRSEDRYAVLPVSGADLQHQLISKFILSVIVMLIGVGILSVRFYVNRNN